MISQRSDWTSPIPVKVTLGGSYLQMKRSTSRVATPSPRTATPSKRLFNTGDRFIPSEVDLDRPIISENYRTCALNFDEKPNGKSAHTEAIRHAMFSNTPSKVLTFGPQRHFKSSSLIFSVMSPIKTPKKTRPSKLLRPAKPCRVFEAPELLDDFYLNPLAWSSDGILAIALNEAVYLGDISGPEIKTAHVYTVPGHNYVSSVEWIDTKHLAVGVSYGRVKIVDVEEGTVVRTLRGHYERVGALCWSASNSLASGGRDGKLIHSDLRKEHHVISSIEAHDDEICQLCWSPNNRMLASGGNDDIVRIWDVANMSRPSVTFTEHTSAVAAIAWNPHEHNMLATGGGSADRTIKLWNAGNGIVKKSVITGAQVCSMVWSPHEAELLTGHGYGFGDNDECKMSLWKMPSVTRIQNFEIGGHFRPLAMAVCPSGSKVCVATSSNSLLIYDMFRGLQGKTYEELTLPESYAKSFGDELPLSDAFWDCMQIR